jgi:predicted ATP-grasp superfamily ATP-dependent carboligase
MDKRPVVVLGAEPRITIPVARSLSQLGVPVFVASVSAADPVLHSRAIAGFFRLPSPMDSPRDFLNALSAKVRSTGADMLIPTTDGALEAISRHYDELKSLLSLACPPPAIVDRVLNKETTLKIAIRLGIRVPLEYAVSSRTSSEVIRQIAFPVIAKPRQKSAAEAFKIRYFRSEPELVTALNNGVLDDAMVQEYCAGEGVGVEMLIHQGNCVAAFQHRRLSEFPHTGGVAVRAVAEPVAPQLADTSLELLRGLEWEGVAMVEFRHDRRTGMAALMEVNGRYWGTVSLPIQAGIDFPAYQWQLAHAEVPNVPSTYEVGMTWRWTAGQLRRWHGLFAHVLKHPRALLELVPCVADLNPFTHDALWKLSDPTPAVLDLAREFTHLLRSDMYGILKRVWHRRPAKSAPPPTQLSISTPERKARSGYEQDS